MSAHERDLWYLAFVSLLRTSGRIHDRDVPAGEAAASVVAGGASKSYRGTTTRSMSQQTLIDQIKVLRQQLDQSAPKKEVHMLQEALRREAASQQRELSRAQQDLEEMRRDIESKRTEAFNYDEIERLMSEIEEYKEKVIELRAEKKEAVAASGDRRSQLMVGELKEQTLRIAELERELAVEVQSAKDLRQRESRRKRMLWAAVPDTLSEEYYPDETPFSPAQQTLISRQKKSLSVFFPHAEWLYSSDNRCQVRLRVNPPGKDDITYQLTAVLEHYPYEPPKLLVTLPTDLKFPDGQSVVAHGEDEEYALMEPFHGIPRLAWLSEERAADQQHRLSPSVLHCLRFGVNWITRFQERHDI